MVCAINPILEDIDYQFALKHCVSSHMKSPQGKEGDIEHDTPI